uniref:Ran-binding protein 3 n=1 Tax=Crocodylus porosus TaxID=8502 RepID=A0A7M4F3H1_CROPO
KDKAQKSSAEQKGLSDSGEDPQGEAESPHRGLGHTEPAGERDFELPAPTVASVSATLIPASEAQLAPIQQELAGRSADGSSPEDGEDSDPEDGSYCPPVKRERTSSLTHSGFRLKPPTLIHGQAPSAGLPSQKPKEQQRSVLRPAVLQAPQPKAFSQMGKSHFSIACVIVFNRDESDETVEVQIAGLPSSDPPSATNYFLQYISSSLENSTNSADPSSNKFVFGQNMSERVLSPPKSNDGGTESNKENTASESGSESSSQEATPEKESLAESAAAYTKATARKCLLEKVEVITGEEAESNVLQIQCKLFVFDKNSQSWVERGRGLLRLNDMASTDDGTLQSRLVMRTQGSLRLILNTKLWAQMQIDKASEKSIRITAMDTEDQGVKVFLISASSKDTGQLYAALHHRILALRSRVEQEQEAKSTAPEPEVSQSNEEDSDDDDVITPSGSAGSGPNDEGDGQNVGST